MIELSPSALERDLREGERDEASVELLDLPAHRFLDLVAWEGAAPDPDTLDAAAFLAWL